MTEAEAEIVPGVVQHRIELPPAGLCCVAFVATGITYPLPFVFIILEEWVCSSVVKFIASVVLNFMLKRGVGAVFIFKRCCDRPVEGVYLLEDPGESIRL